MIAGDTNSKDKLLKHLAWQMQGGWFVRSEDFAENSEVAEHSNTCGYFKLFDDPEKITWLEELVAEGKIEEADTPDGRGWRLMVGAYGEPAGTREKILEDLDHKLDEEEEPPTVLTFPTDELPGIAELAKKMLGFSPWREYDDKSPWFGGPEHDAHDVVPLHTHFGFSLVCSWMAARNVPEFTDMDLPVPFATLSRGDRLEDDCDEWILYVAGENGVKDIMLFPCMAFVATERDRVTRDTYMTPENRRMVLPALVGLDGPGREEEALLAVCNSYVEYLRAKKEVSNNG